MNAILRDGRDQALFNACPIHPAPRYEQFLPLSTDGRRYVAAADGIYLETRSDHLHALVRLTELSMPYGEVKEFIELKNGPVPSRLLQEFVLAACQSSPHEIAGIVAPSADGYALQTPNVISRSASHVEYSDLEYEQIVIDIHSHGAHNAYFSATDDASDLSRFGSYIAIVVGHCSSYRDVRWVARLVCGMHLVPLDVNGPLLKAVIA